MPLSRITSLFQSATANVYSPSANTVAIRTSSTDRFTVTSDGNLGLGVTPSAWYSSFKALQIGSGATTLAYYGSASYFGTNWYSNVSGVDTYVGNGYSTRYDQSSTGQHRWFTAPSGTAGNAITFTQAMTLDASGNLLVGATAAVNSCSVIRKDQANSVLIVQNGHGSAGLFGVQVRYSGVDPNSTGSSPYEFYVSHTATLRFEVRSNGGIANYSGNNVNLSDRREKMNFAPAKNYLDVICAIPVQTFNYIDQNMEEDDGLTLGVVAQDVQAVAPELVMESNWAKDDDEPKMRLSVYQTDLQYALMKCIQELKAELDATKAEVAALKGTA